MKNIPIYKYYCTKGHNASDSGKLKYYLATYVRDIWCKTCNGKLSIEK